MKQLLLAVVCFLVMGTVVIAQDDFAAYQAWMKDVGAANGSLRKNLESKNGPGVAADAKKLADIFAQVHAYWEKQNVADAMKFAMDSQAGYAEAAKLAEAGNVDGAAEAATKAAANCQGCHQAHRERTPDGAYKMK